MHIYVYIQYIYIYSIYIYTDIYTVYIYILYIYIFIYIQYVYIYIQYIQCIYIQYIHMFIEFLNPGRQKPRDKNQPQKSSNSFIEPQGGILSLVFFGRILGKNEPQNASNYLKLAQTALKIIRTASNC